MIPSSVQTGVEALAKLGYARLPVEVHERFEEELSLLRGEMSFRDRHYYVQFLAPSTLIEHLPEGALLVLDEIDDIRTALEEETEQAEASRKELEDRAEIPKGLPKPLAIWDELRAQTDAHGRTLTLSRWATGENDDALRLPFTAAPAFGGQLRKLVLDSITDAQAGKRTVVVTQQAQRLAELFQEQDQPAAVTVRIPEEPGLITVVQGSLSEGWKLDDDDPSLTLAHRRRGVRLRQAAPRRAEEGDQPRGVPRRACARARSSSTSTTASRGSRASSSASVDGHEREYLELHYAEGDKLFVPTDQLDRVSRYIGPSDRAPHLTRLGSGEWQRAKQRARRAVRAAREGAAGALRRARGAAGLPLLRGHRLAGGDGGRPSPTSRRRTRSPRSPPSSGTWRRRSRWTASSAATSATARRRSRSAPRSRR